MKEFKKYIVVQKIGKENDAGSKARADVIEICHARGFQDFELVSEQFQNRKIYIHHARRFLEPLEQRREIAKQFKFLESESTVLMQYPLPGYLKHASTLTLLKKIKQKKRLKIYAIIHDLDSLRNVNKSTVAFEKKWISIFDALIAHNEVMKSYLISKCHYTKKIETLVFFDYLTDFEPTQPSLNDSSVIFAGNLNKSLFCKELKCIPQVIFNLYGPITDPSTLQAPNVRYCGQASPDKIVSTIQGDYGLVWDGPQIETCSGSYGEYLKYNTSHKLSLYIVAGKPLIVWKNSALADYITKQQIGFAVSSLSELPAALSNITKEQYECMCRNVRTIAKEISCGPHLAHALESIL